MTGVITNKYHHWAIWSFVVLSALGALLRLLLVYPISGLNYSYLLHAHSHLAFSGWVFLSLALLIARKLNAGESKPGYRRVFIATIISAVGMLFSFSFQGYKAISISFSTIFLFVGYFFAFLVLRDKNLNFHFKGLSSRFIKASLYFLVISSIGPLLLGPLMVSGLKDSPLYHNAIYFYLHFQMNGWMLLAVLGLVLNRYLSAAVSKKDLIAAQVFLWSTAPLYLIFTLWTGTSIWVNVLALTASVLNMSSWFRLLFLFRNDTQKFPLLVKVALVAITVKVCLQVLVCIPDIGLWVFSQRGLIIGYIHLLTLGFIVPIIIAEMARAGFLLNDARLNTFNKVFVVLVVLYLGVLFLQPALALFSLSIPFYHTILLVISCLFVLSAIMYATKLRS